ncbi:23S rRNA (guanosine(2251)-2'-O)-methyltransferase RlmB [Acidaminococcus sp. LBK-2]|uniref:23S rRNA (guanosine(2251)-2'-O)-methyltransferase RlmB n=1 Tax=Acidaminococcus TaxID=904 RepID=UPI00242AA0DC|nr:23S rRNA (guanosine(2251)-2'-O)-methyltransferase RlmB [Acidaminococcus fermentans]
MEDIIVGRNAVREALRSRRPFNKVLVQEGTHGGSLNEILALAEERQIPVEKVAKEVLDRLAGGVRHQGVAAQGAPVAFQDLDTVLAQTESRGEVPLLLLLDELQDPQNVGALIRTANAAGVHGVLLPQRRSCPLNAVVAKISAGAIEYVPVIQIGNITQTMKQLKKRGFWIAGADMDGEAQYFDANLTGPMVLVVGAEGKGLGRLVKENCDFIVRIPMLGQVSSLNASVAGGILLYDIVRQRILEGRKKAVQRKE